MLLSYNKIINWLWDAMIKQFQQEYDVIFDQKKLFYSCYFE